MFKTTRFILTSILLAVLSASCKPAAPTADPAIALTQAFQTAFAQINQPTATPAITDTPVPTDAGTARPNR